ncbi:aminoglycoside phosphotransferase family protein [Phytohalomonas tamaricis]|uniref:aminoglycoside phosphotransferase family protein n=1 Tax=Phytohalomonas tamaricis TaxID=2081032 RepID=UPI000D0AE78C|nr:phosphotransferase [Phytohalomonas tamaricis]
MTARIDALRQWIAAGHGLSPDAINLCVVADDASFRRYFRVRLPDGSTRILMDAPPDKEDSRPFVTIAKRWRQGGLPVPRLNAIDLDAGFIEMQDLGDVMLRQRLEDEHRAEPYIQQALSLAIDIALQPADELPPYDHQRLAFELDLFPEWCLLQWLDIAAPASWEALRNDLITSVLAQPQVTTHRDYHAQNLICHDERLWVIDFQGAWRGALTYDLASLLRDRNAPWPAATQKHWIEAYQYRAEQAGLLAPMSAENFQVLVAQTTAQRSLKVLGLFCRLSLRDGKHRYLAMMPHFLTHLRQALSLLGHENFTAWLDNDFTPSLTSALQRHSVTIERTQ